MTVAIKDIIAFQVQEDEFSGNGIHIDEKGVVLQIAWQHSCAFSLIGVVWTKENGLEK